MELQGSITINGKKYEKGQRIAWYTIYPFFLLHMGMFGLSGFYMAYAENAAPLLFLYAHGGFACFVYVLFYVTIFGVDSVRWMFINAALGLFGIYAQIDWILSLFDKQAGDYSAFVHFIPFFYYVLYTFLLHQMVLDLFHGRGDEQRRQRIDLLYIVASVLVYGSFWLNRA